MGFGPANHRRLESRLTGSPSPVPSYIPKLAPRRHDRRTESVIAKVRVGSDVPVLDCLSDDGEQGHNGCRNPYAVSIRG